MTLKRRELQVVVQSTRMHAIQYKYMQLQIAANSQKWKKNVPLEQFNLNRNNPLEGATHFSQPHFSILLGTV